LATEKRTNIFTGEIKKSLKEYLTFRHFIRHAYAYSIDAQRINPLINNVEALWVLVKRDLKGFLNNN
jgi:uncharacterized protein YutE (UPF0331/DUF86 family)